MRSTIVILSCGIFVLMNLGRAFGQNYVGFEGGANISGVVFDREAGVRALQKITPYYGFSFTHIPEGRKPGITLSLHILDHGFNEINRDTLVNFQLRGYQLDVMSHLYLQLGKTRLFLNLGPGISYLPVTLVDYPEISALPPFNEQNLNEVYMSMGGGPGITQSLGPIDLTVFGSVTYFISDVYQNVFWDSNIISLKGGIRLQYGFGWKKED